jgi:dienelactone hydrolase
METRRAQAERFEIKNRDGQVHCEFYHAGSDRAVIYMHGVGGGTHGPANIYHPLAEELAKDDISSLLIECRYHSDLEESVSDILACIDYLDSQYHMSCIGLIGWSFGGAVVISAAATDRRVRTVVTVASQSGGTGDVDKMSASILLLHGTGDRTLPYSCSVDIADRAHEPKKIVLFPGADHGISQYRDKTFKLIKEWILEQLQCP